VKWKGIRRDELASIKTEINHHHKRLEEDEEETTDNLGRIYYSHHEIEERALFITSHLIYGSSSVEEKTLSHQNSSNFDHLNDINLNSVDILDHYDFIFSLPLFAFNHPNTQNVKKRDKDDDQQEEVGNIRHNHFFPSEYLPFHQQLEKLEESKLVDQEEVLVFPLLSATTPHHFFLSHFLQGNLHLHHHRQQNEEEFDLAPYHEMNLEIEDILMMGEEEREQVIKDKIDIMSYVHNFSFNYSSQENFHYCSILGKIHQILRLPHLII